MLISMDFDDTFTADTDFWWKFIESAKAHGHAVVCVTSRYETPENRREIEAAMPGIPVVFANKYKRDAARAAGHFVDVWIDDCPEGIAEPLPMFGESV